MIPVSVVRNDKEYCLLPMDGMLVQHRLPPAFGLVTLTVRRSQLILLGGEMHNQSSA